MKIKIIDYIQDKVIAEISREYGLYLLDTGILINLTPWEATKLDAQSFEGLNEGDLAWCLMSKNEDDDFKRELVKIDLYKEILK